MSHDLLSGYVCFLELSSDCCECTMNHCSLINLYRYTIHNLEDERKYLVNIELSVCTESGCEANYTIFKEMLLPKQNCSWNSGLTNTSNISES